MNRTIACIVTLALFLCLGIGAGHADTGDEDDRPYIKRQMPARKLSEPP